MTSLSALQVPMSVLLMTVTVWVRVGTPHGLGARDALSDLLRHDLDISGRKNELQCCQQCQFWGWTNALISRVWMIVMNRVRMGKTVDFGRAFCAG